MKYNWSLIPMLSMLSMEGEDDAAAKAAADKAAADKAAADADATKARGEKKFTDSDMGRMRKAHEAELKKSAEQNRKLSEDMRLTQEERDAASKRADELEAQFKTEKQLSDERAQKLIADHKKVVETLTKERDTAQKAHSDLMIDVELQRESALAEELVPGQLTKFLRPDTELADELGEDAKATGRKVVRVNFDDVDKDNKPVRLKLSVKDALKRMKELPNRFGNFFKGTGTGGVGAGNGAGGPVGEIPTNTDAYIAKRQKLKEAGKI